MMVEYNLTIFNQKNARDDRVWMIPGFSQLVEKRQESWNTAGKYKN